MASVNQRRSQVILRMPVDHLNASLILHDGEHLDVVLFISPSDDIARVLGSTEPFLPMVRNGRVVLIARSSIATLGLPAVPVVPQEGDLPIEKQAAVIKLRSGAKLEGELQWTGPAGRQRTADHLNAEELFFKVHTADTTHYVVKSHVAMVEER
jgi:hypothetical protein